MLFLTFGPGIGKFATVINLLLSWTSDCKTATTLDSRMLAHHSPKALPRNHCFTALTVFLQLASYIIQLSAVQTRACLAATCFLIIDQTQLDDGN